MSRILFIEMTLTVVIYFILHLFNAVWKKDVSESQILLFALKDLEQGIYLTNLLSLKPTGHHQIQPTANKIKKFSLREKRKACVFFVWHEVLNLLILATTICCKVKDGFMIVNDKRESCDKRINKKMSKKCERISHDWKN